MSLKSNLNSWVRDRIDEKEPLMLNEFKNFIKRLGYSNSQLKKVLTKQKLKQIKILHKKGIKSKKRKMKL